MAQIFISHSSHDKEIISHFAKAFSGTKVKAVFEEFEKMLGNHINQAKIKQDIEASNAVFILLSEKASSLKHTRDWVVWESGVGSNKDIWVFEPISDSAKISIVIPRLNHLVLYDLHEIWQTYIRTIVQSYDDSHVLASVLAGSIEGAAIAHGNSKKKNKSDAATAGALVGGVGALLLSQLSVKKPTAPSLFCNKCASIYQLHLGDYSRPFRCPVCNAGIKAKWK